MSDFWSNGLSGIIGAGLGAGASYLATLQANRHAAKLAQDARKQQRLDQVAADRAAKMAMAWRVSAIFNYQVAFVRGLHRSIETDILRGEALHPEAEIYEVLLPRTGIPAIDRYRPDDLATLVSLRAFDIIVPLQQFESDSVSLQYATERYSDLRMEFRRSVSSLPHELSQTQAKALQPQIQELHQLAEMIRKDASDAYTRGEVLHPQLNDIFRNAFGDLGFPKMVLMPFDLEALPE